MNEDFLKRKLNQRKESSAYRELGTKKATIDFCSNDYLGLSASGKITVEKNGQEKFFGSTGSRLISGNYPLIEDVEKEIATFHNAEAGLIFNSGYDANMGLLSAIPQRHDTILYDELSHASIRDGIRLSHSFAFSFSHNNTDDLERRLQNASGNVFVVTESIFSMDGDMAPLEEISELCEVYNARLVVDEAHATGVWGERGEGVVQSLNLEGKCFARVHTFGKALGCQGAIVLGSDILRQYLINFSRQFIYTTAMPASSVLAIRNSYNLFPAMDQERKKLHELISHFRSTSGNLRLCKSVTPIQGVIIPGNEQVKEAAKELQERNFDIRPILYPTVPRELERLRIVLHSYNSVEEVDGLLDVLKQSC